MNNINTNIRQRDESFKERHPEDTFDRSLWKQFWFRHQKYHTVCLPCLSSEKEIERKYPAEQESDPNWGAVMLEDSGRALITSWYKEAKHNLFGPDAKSNEKIAIDVSDDEDGDDEPIAWARDQIVLSKSTSKIAVSWLRSARSRIQSGKRSRGGSALR